MESKVHQHSMGGYESGGLIDVLITDTITAAAVLDLQDKWEHAARQPFSF